MKTSVLMDNQGVLIKIVCCKRKRIVCCKLLTNCLSVFDNFVGLALKGLRVGTLFRTLLVHFVPIFVPIDLLVHFVLISLCVPMLLSTLQWKLTLQTPWYVHVRVRVRRSDMLLFIAGTKASKYKERFVGNGLIRPH